MKRVAERIFKIIQENQQKALCPIIAIKQQQNRKR
jgi:hypothetical protein